MNFCLAVFLLLQGYGFRMLRTMLILNKYVNKPASAYWSSLGCGYLFEFFSPIRISDAVRTFVFSKISKTPWQLSLAAMILERCFDFFFLAGILYFVSLNFISVLIAFTILLIALLSLSCTPVKKVYFQISLLFNNRIRNFLLGIYWSLFRIVKDLSFLSILMLIFLTVCIWVSYYFSVYMISQLILDLQTIIFLQFSSIHNINIWNIFSYFKSGSNYIYLCYIFIPNILALLIGACTKKSKHTKQYNIIPFLSIQDSLSFYDLFFNNLYLKDSETYYQLIHTGFKISDLSAASEAKTYLIEENDSIFIRKIALNNAAEKLKDQYEWLIQNSNLHVPKIYNKQESKSLFKYDMEYFVNGESFFTMIHYMSIDESFNILTDILDDIKSTYHKKDANIQEVTEKYFTEKVLKNRQAIINSDLGFLSDFDTLIVNNNELPNILYKDVIEEMAKYNAGLFYPIFQIHGDLTIENILVNKSGEYMIIDPAPSYINIFAEFAKLFQSLHANYEHLKKVENFSNQDNIIIYAQYATLQYEKLFKKLQQYIMINYGNEGLKAVYFYEAICHLRTTSYMIKLQNPKSLLMIAAAGNALKKWKEIEI